VLRPDRSVWVVGTEREPRPVAPCYDGYIHIWIPGFTQLSTEGSPLTGNIHSSEAGVLICLFYFLDRSSLPCQGRRSA